MKKNTITTYGIKYTVSKLKILPYILSVIDELDGVQTVLDGFSGTTRVAQAFAQKGYTTTVSDISSWSDVFGHCFLIANKKDAFYQEIIDHLKHHLDKVVVDHHKDFHITMILEEVEKAEACAIVIIET